MLWVIYWLNRTKISSGTRMRVGTARNLTAPRAGNLTRDFIPAFFVELTNENLDKKRDKVKST